MAKKKASDSGQGRSKGAKKKQTKRAKIREHLSPRQNALIEGILGGKSTHRAALDAGYSPNTAQHPGELLDTQRMREALASLIAPVEKIAQRINEGLDAKITEFAKFEGRITHSVDCIDFEQRRQYAALAAKLKGLDPSSKLEVKGDLTQFVKVEFVNVATCPEP
jgi:hypothetical protein